MAPNDGPSRIHGLHGKKLMYAAQIPTLGAQANSNATATSQVFLYH